MRREGYFMSVINVREFLQQISLPKRYFDNDFVMVEKYTQEMEHFFGIYDLCGENVLSEEKQEVLNKSLVDARENIEKNFNSILDVLNAFENSELAKAENALDELMENIKNDMFISDMQDSVKINVAATNCQVFTSFHLGKGYKFYRVRAVQNPTLNIEKNPYELFHLPLKKRELVSANRFGLNGFPSLYLSSMLPLAWQETGYPRKYYYSEFQPNLKYNEETKQFEECKEWKNLKLLALYSPDEIATWGLGMKGNDFELWLCVLLRYLKCYPLILACSFVNTRGDVPYKQEYIIPQMLMQWVCRNNEDVQGINYFSCLDLSINTGGWCAYNIGFPATKTFDDYGYSNLLKSAFNWSKPIFYSVPTLDRTLNKDERKLLNGYIEDVLFGLRNGKFVRCYQDYLVKMLHVATNVYTILDKAESSNAELMLNMLKSVEQNYCSVSQIDISTVIEQGCKDVEAKKDICLIPLEEMITKMQKFADDFKNIVGKIINDHQLKIWNSLADDQYLDIYYTENVQVIDMVDFLQKNNILFHLHQLANENVQKQLEKLCKFDAITMDMFWSMDIGEKNWQEDNLDNVEFPLVIKEYSPSSISNDKISSAQMISKGNDFKSIKKYYDID